MKWQNDYLRLEDIAEAKFDKTVSGDCRVRWFIRTVTVAAELVSENDGITWNTRRGDQLETGLSSNGYVIALPHTVSK
jgi:hypothetical protein